MMGNLLPRYRRILGHNVENELEALGSVGRNVA